jgi:hypothetical protein
VSVGTTATLICTVGSAPENDGALVQNNGSTPVFLGGSTVTASGATAGVQVAAGATVTVPTTGAEPLSLYGKFGAGRTVIGWLWRRRWRRVIPFQAPPEHPAQRRGPQDERLGWRGRIGGFCRA